MAVTLAQAKNYLKLDNDITDDDELVTSLISAAGDYVRRTTGKVNTGDNQSQLYDLCIKMLVAHCCLQPEAGRHQRDSPYCDRFADSYCPVQ